LLLLLLSRIRSIEAFIYSDKAFGFYVSVMIFLYLVSPLARSLFQSIPKLRSQNKYEEEEKQRRKKGKKEKK